MAEGGSKHMTARMFRSMACGAGLSAFLASSALAYEPAALKWTPRLELGAFYGSSNTSRGEAALWVPLTQGSTALLFGEARGKLFEDDMHEGNFALGYRQMMASGWNFGIWGGYDIRQSQYGNRFHQLAGGIEILSDRWDFRANAYLPLNDSETLFSASVVTTGSELEFTGSTIGLVTTTTTTTTRLEELALWGFDAEIGAKIFATSEDLPGPRHELRLYAGAFHFDHADLPKSVTGPRVRAEWRMDSIVDQWAGSRLALEAEYSHDAVRDDRFEVGVRLRLPLGGSETRTASRALTAQERRMAEGLERDTDIVTSTAKKQSTASSSATEAVKDEETGVRFDRVAMVDGTGDLTATSSTAGDNTLIIASGTLAGAHTLQGNQTLMGGDATIRVQGVTSGIVVDFTAGGPAAILSDASNAVNLTLVGDNTHIAGLEIAGSGFGAPANVGVLVASGVRDVRIADTHIDNTGGHGITFGTLSSGVVSGGGVERTVLFGIVIGQGSTVSIMDTTIADAGIDGINIGSASDVTIAGTTITDTVGNGIIIGGSSTVTLTDSALAGTFGSDGIRFNGIGNALAGANNTAAEATFGGQFCNSLDPSTTNGSFGFDIGNCQ